MRAPGGAGDQSGRRVVPEIDALFYVAVEPTVRDQTDVEGAGPEPSDVAHPRQQPGHGSPLDLAPPGLVAEAGPDQSVPQRSRTAYGDRLPVAQSATTPSGPGRATYSVPAATSSTIPVTTSPSTSAAMETAYCGRP